MNLLAHEDWMREAITQAQKAADIGEVPVGAVVVQNDAIIGYGYNRCITDNDPSAHAEIVALRDAAERVGNYRLTGSRLYVTLEPCMMCSGAIVHARIRQLVYGASDPKSGVIEFCDTLLQSDYLNHKVNYVSGVLAEECGSMLSRFFQERRKK